MHTELINLFVFFLNNKTHIYTSTQHQIFHCWYEMDNNCYHMRILPVYLWTVQCSYTHICQAVSDSLLVLYYRVVYIKYTPHRRLLSFRPIGHLCRRLCRQFEWNATGIYSEFGNRRHTLVGHVRASQNQICSTCSHRAGASSVSTLCSRKKEATKLMRTVLSFLNRFSEFFHWQTLCCECAVSNSVKKTSRTVFSA